MITISRSDKLAIHIELEYNDIPKLLNMLKSMHVQSANCMVIEFDRGVTKEKRFLETTPRKLSIGQGGNAIQEVGDTLELKLEPETADSFRDRLEQCVLTKDFFPSELGEFSVGGRDALNDVYCILK